MKKLPNYEMNLMPYEFYVKDFVLEGNITKSLYMAWGLPEVIKEQ